MKNYETKLKKLLSLVKENPEIKIRDCSKKLHIPHKDVYQLAEDLALNINIGIQVNGAIGVFERKGDYTLEYLGD